MVSKPYRNDFYISMTFYSPFFFFVHLIRNNGCRICEYIDRGKIVVNLGFYCATFIGQFAHPLGGEGMGSGRDVNFSQLQISLYKSA